MPPRPMGARIGNKPQVPGTSQGEVGGVGRKNRIWYPGAVYHVCARGNQGQLIFRCTGDETSFLEMLERLVREKGCQVLAFCLMRNHYHLLLQANDKHLSQSMHLLNSSYSRYFHKKYETTGHLFQGRYRSVLVQNDGHLLEASRYIHLNPVQAGMVEQPDQYAMSSYRFYAPVPGPGFRDGMPAWLDISLLLGMMDANPQLARLRYQHFVLEKMGDPDYADELESRIHPADVLGSAEFVREALATYQASKDAAPPRRAPDLVARDDASTGYASR